MYVMNLNKHIFPALSFVAIMAILLLIVFRKEPKPVYPISSVKTIETRVENKEEDVLALMNQIAVDKQVVYRIGRQIVDLKLQLQNAKSVRDTLLIIQIQDTVINMLTSENKSLKVIVKNQDSVIVAQRYIINSKDTIIQIGKHQVKKIKRQRNWSLVANGVLVGALILK